MQADRRVLRQADARDDAFRSLFDLLCVCKYPAIDHERYFSFRARNQHDRSGSRCLVSFAYRLDNMDFVRRACAALGWSVYVHDGKVREVWQGAVRDPEQFLVVLCEPGVPQQECVEAVLNHPWLLVSKLGCK